MAKKLPKKVEQHVDKSPLFNMFGLINLNVVRISTKTRLSSKELKSRIVARFSSECVGNRIEFIEK